MESVLGLHAVPADVKTLICQKAEGNPFYLEEISRSFVDSGILSRANGGYVLARAVTPQDVPDTVQGVIMARIDRLAEARKRTIQTAAVVGREFGLRLLRQISDIQERIEESLTDLKSLEFIYEKALFPDLEYVFKHALVQDVAYGSLLKPRRRALHELVAGAIEELYADRLEDHAAELAHHYGQGEVWPKAFEYARQAGERARAIFANREAIHHYTQALEAAAKMTPPPGDADLLTIYEARGLVWHLLTNYDAAVADFEAMQGVARRLGDRGKEGEALCNQGASHWFRFSQAHKGLVEKCAHEAMAVAEETRDERVLARALLLLGMVDQKAGALREADDKMRRSIEICRRRALKGPLITNLVWMGAHANWRAEFRQALEHVTEASRLAQESHEGFFEIVARCFRC
ncbi:MAG: ATP-binding protein, partial [bacterium]